MRLALPEMLLAEAIRWVWTVAVDAAVGGDRSTTDWHCDWCGRDMFNNPGKTPPLGWSENGDKAYCCDSCRRGAMRAAEVDV